MFQVVYICSAVHINTLASQISQVDMQSSSDELPKPMSDGILVKFLFIHFLLTGLRIRSTLWCT